MGLSDRGVSRQDIGAWALLRQAKGGHHEGSLHAVGAGLFSLLKYGTFAHQPLYYEIGANPNLTPVPPSTSGR